MNLTLTPLGGAAEIAANSYLLETPHGNLLLDCGMGHRGDYNERIPLLTRVSVPLHAIIVTHAHTDHIGSLPVVAAEFPDVPIYMTRPTKFIGAVMLEDAYKLIRTLSVDPTNPPWYHSLYSSRTLERLLEQVHVVEEGEPVEIKGYAASLGFTLQFRNAGHILGSAMAEIKIGDRTLLYTGDLQLRDTLLERAADISNLENKVDVLVCEATYMAVVLPAQTKHVKAR